MPRNLLSTRAGSLVPALFFAGFLKRRGSRLGNAMILIAGSPADADRAHNFSPAL